MFSAAAGAPAVTPPRPATWSSRIWSAPRMPVPANRLSTVWNPGRVSARRAGVNDTKSGCTAGGVVDGVVVGGAVVGGAVVAGAVVGGAVVTGGVVAGVAVTVTVKSLVAVRPS